MVKAALPHLPEGGAIMAMPGAVPGAAPAAAAKPEAREWKSYIPAVIVASAIFAFIAQPILKWSGIYLPLNWPYSYAFISLILLGLFTKWLQVKILGINEALVPAERTSYKTHPVATKPFRKSDDDK
jgi:hypothetical protein